MESGRDGLAGGAFTVARDILTVKHSQSAATIGVQTTARVVRTRRGPWMPNAPDAVGHPEAVRILDAVERLLRHRARTWAELEVEVGVSEAQGEILASVDAGDRQVSAVAESCGRHVSTASRLVDQLVRSGHLDRVEDPDDRRAVLLTLTPEGVAALRSIEERHGAMLGEALRRLGPSGASRLADAIEQLAATVDEIATSVPETA